MTTPTKLVQREPTVEMMRAGDAKREWSINVVWRAMWDAAPAPAADPDTRDATGWCDDKLADLAKVAEAVNRINMPPVPAIVGVARWWRK